MINKILIKIYEFINTIIDIFWFKIEYTWIKKYEWIREYWFDSVIDVWANKWQSIKLWQWALRNSTDIYSFEPLSEDFDILKKKYWNKSNIRLYNMWLWSVKEEKYIYLCDSHDSSSLLVPSEKQKTTYEQKFEIWELIKIDTLDNIFLDTLKNKNVLMKIDVQWYELEVLKWWTKILKNINMIIIENSYSELYIWQPLFDDIYEYLNSHWYKYIWSLYQSISPINWKPMQQDSIYIKNS